MEYWIILQILELEESISQMKIIHVAGTKGKVLISTLSWIETTNLHLLHRFDLWFGSVLTLAQLIGYGCFGTDCCFVLFGVWKGIHMHILWINLTQLWLPHWTFHISSSHWYSREISIGWVSWVSYKHRRSKLLLNKGLGFTFNGFILNCKFLVASAFCLWSTKYSEVSFVLFLNWL